MFSEQPDDGLSRRTFLKGTGLAVGAGLLGETGIASASAASFDDRFLNWRTIEARKVWARGYRGRPDRSLALTDSGVDARHPELGPWNGVRAEVRRNQLVIPTGEEGDAEKGDQVGGEEFSGTILPGTIVGPTTQRESHEFTTPGGADNVVATMDGGPNGPQGLGTDNELYLEKGVDNDDDGQVDEWRRVGTSTNPGSLEEIDTFVEGDHRYRFVVESWVSGPYSYEITAEFYELEGEFNAIAGEAARLAWLEGDDDAGITGIDGEVDATTPKTVCWVGSTDEPLDDNGHGSHVSGIMAGSGRGSTIDDVEVHEPRTVLAPTEFLEYDVEAEAGTNVFASAFGDGIEVHIVGPDDRELHTATMQGDSIVADEPTHDDEYHPKGESATYTVQVRPWESRSATEDVASDAQEGTPAAGRVQRIAVGTFRHQSETVGERLDDGAPAFHPGLAPNASIVGVEGLSDATRLFGQYAGDFSDVFNVRAVNMSWGWLGGAPLGVAGGETDSGVTAAVRDIATAGVLPVSAAGNSYTPANSGSPATADEAISVVATGPLDGITSYSSGGVAAVDEDEPDVYGKPDVTAPGGDAEPDGAGRITMSTAEAVAEAETGIDVPISYPVPSILELERSVLAGPIDEDLPADRPRDFRDAGGTSMASPYVCGMAGLVAQAMEEDAPDPIALPEPSETAFDDVMRVKQAILATANETAFTAAPYHSAKVVGGAPTYSHGGRDPYEGYGRANPDAAVDAVTRNLLGDGPEGVPELGGDPQEETYEESVGLYVPEDARAVAGYVRVPGGDLEASIEFDRYSGGNAGMTMGDPHLDLFVYDAEEPADHGEPNVVASDQGVSGTASVSVDVDRGTSDDPTERTFLVVAKIVNVPGVVNGFDVRAHFDLDVAFDPAGAFEAPAVDLDADGYRDTDSSVFTGGQIKRVTVTVEGFNDVLTDEVRVCDEFPPEWKLLPYGDNEGEEAVEDGDRVIVDLGTVARDDLGTDAADRTYLLEAPEGLEETGQYTFGPAEAAAVDPETFEDDPDRRQGSTEEEFTGTNTATLVGQNV